MTVVEFPVPFREGDRVPFDVDSVNLYRNSKWNHLIPLPYGKQTPPPSGFSGRNAKVPDKDQYKRWIRESRAGARAALGGDKKSGPFNIAVVHGFLTIAIDVDDYDYVDKKTQETKHKHGKRSLAKLERQLGALPATWVSSARGAPDESGSGQRFFRLKAEHASNILKYNDKPADSIEIVRGGHRYSVVWPSLNARLNQQYVWWKQYAKGDRSSGITEDTEPGEWVIMDGPPAVAELPYLPDNWVKFLTNDFTPFEEVRKHEKGTFKVSDHREWIAERSLDSDGADLPLCNKMQRCLDRALAKIQGNEEDEAEGGAHDTMVHRMHEAMALAHEGHSGLQIFLSQLHDAFVDEVQGRRDGGARAAEEEFQRAFSGEFDRITMREDPPGNGCPCFKSSDASFGEFAGVEISKDFMEFPRNDSGNAEFLVELTKDNYRYVPGWKTWVSWDARQNIWVMSEDDEQITRLAGTVGEAYQARARYLHQYLQDNPDLPAYDRDMYEKEAKVLLKWGVATGNNSRIKNMIDLAKARDGISVSAEEFDSKPNVLICNNGTIDMPRSGWSADYTGLELGHGVDGEVNLRPSRREDFTTQSTGIDYLPWSEIRNGGEAKALLPARRTVEEYLEIFLPEVEVRTYVQRVLGYAMYGANPERKLVFLQGPTSTGKSTILAGLSGALGNYASAFNLSLLREKQDEGPRTELVQHLPRRIITATEGGQEWHLHADMIKRITGGSDKVSGRKLFSNDIVSRVPAFTPIIAANTAPTIDNGDSALWRRLLVLPFDVQVGMDGAGLGGVENGSGTNGHNRPGAVAPTMQKVGMDDFMATDLGCRMVWLSWLVEGYASYARMGLGSVPAAVVQRTNLFQSGLSDFHSFVASHLARDRNTIGMKVAFNRVYEAYEMWCFENRIKQSQQISKIAFSKKLVANGFELQKSFPRKTDAEYVHGKKVRVNWILDSAMIVEQVRVKRKFNVVVEDKKEEQDGDG